MSRSGPPGEDETKPPSGEDEPTMRITRGRAPSAAGEDEEPTLPVPAGAVQAVLAAHGMMPPEHASAVIPAPRRPRPQAAEGEPGDGSVDVVFDPSTGEIIKKEITTILAEVGQEAPLAPAPRASDPDVHSAEVEYEPDKTLRLRRR